MTKVIIAGSINMDIVANVRKHPVPGETLPGYDLQQFPGGKGANQAIAARKSGAETILIGSVGKDAAGQELTAFLTSHDVTLHIKQVDGTTGTAMIAVAKDTGDNTIIVVPGANAQLSVADIDKTLIAAADILLSQFEIPSETILAFFQQGRVKNTFNIFNAAPALPISDALYEVIDLLIVNETELAALSGAPAAVDDDVLVKSVAALDRPQLKILVTLGSKGAALIENGKALRFEGMAVKPVDTTGAGDCFCGVLAGALSQGADLKSAITTANRAAAISVTRPGAAPSMPNKDEIAQPFSS